MANEKFLIQYFNTKKGQRIGFTDNNISQVKRCFDAGYGESAIRARVLSYSGSDFAECFDPSKMGVTTPAPAPEAPAFATAVAATIPMSPAVGDSLGSTLDILGRTLAEVIAKTESERIATSIMGNVQNTVEEYIAKNYGTLPKIQIVEIADRAVELSEVVHDKFATVLQFVQMNEPVFLTGAAGTGKNVICKQVAQTLGLDFFFSNAVTQEYKITGFTDAMGKFQESQFYKAFKNGGLFMLDEIDASIPEVLVILNAAIANRYFDFPAPIGYVEAHPDFRVVAAGNTYGTGATHQYVGRNQLDAASLDRFAMVGIDYSKEIEKSVAQNDVALVEFARSFRESAAAAGIQIVVSYRSIGRIAKMQAAMAIDDVLRSCLLKGMEVDDIRMIKKGMRLDNSNKYFKSLSNLC